MLKILVRLFFDRFFDNELVPAESDVRQTVVQILAVLATPGFLLPFYFMPRYVKLHFQPPELFGLALTVDRYVFVVAAVAGMGLVTALAWDSLFPDRRDYRVLTPLPLPVRLIFGAKTVALLGFLLMFAVVLNLGGTLLFPCFATTGREPAWAVSGTIARHAVTMLAASAFSFFGVLCLEGVLLNLLPLRWFHRISVAAQFVVLSGLLLLFLSTPLVLGSLHRWRASNDPLLQWLPPAWFLGVYERLAGTQDPVLLALSERAVVALAIVFAGSAVSYALAYRTHIRRTLEMITEVSTTPSRLRLAAERALHRVVLRDPVERATFHFIAVTLRRSRRHLLFLSAYASVGCALVLEALLGLLARSPARPFAQPSAEMLSLPLVFSFFVLSGLRVVFTIPSELRANWVFRLSEAAEPARHLSAVWKVMVIFGAAPIFLLVLPLYAGLWGWTAALACSGFALVLTLLLAECALLHFHKIPFTCSYLPGKAKLTATWALYGFAFSFYAYGMARTGIWLMGDPIRVPVFYGSAAVMLAGLRGYRRVMMRQGDRLVFFEEPEPAVRTLDVGLRVSQ